jgi:hypothetical protein
MLRHSSMKSTVVFLAALCMVCSSFAFAQQAPQQPAQGQAGAGQRGQAGRAGGAGQARPGEVVAPLYLKVEWVRPPIQTAQVPMIQENIVDPNVEVKWYGAAAKKLLTTGTPGSDVAPFGVWSGECDGPFAITFRLKNNSSVDMTGLANIRWFVKTSGFHVVRPVIVLPDGTMLVADLPFSSIPMLTQSEFSLLGLHWLKLDKDRIVTLGRNPAPANEIWVPDPDLSKVDEVGFVDLMPSSGHGTGGYIQLSQVEVFGKSVPHDATTTSNAN